MKPRVRRLWVNRVTLTARRRCSPDQRTFTESCGMLQKCQRQKSSLLFDYSARDSGDEINARSVGLCRLDFLSSCDALLIGLNRFCVCVGCLICDQPDFCLDNHDLGRINGSYGAHIPS
jgi:hypothetical protein